MFVYSLAKGVNEGWLSPAFAPAAITGWNGVATRVLPDGRLDGVCEGTTYANDSTYYFYRGAGPNTTFFGAALYAGLEVMKLVQNPAVTIKPATPGAVNSAIHAAPGRGPPEDQGVSRAPARTPRVTKERSKSPMRKHYRDWMFLGVALALGAFVATSSIAAAEKPRVLVLTDIENEPDDAMSMVRFLTYANHFDVEGLVATTSIHQRDKTAAQRIREIVEAYGKVRDNLEKHESGLPDRRTTCWRGVSEGLPVYGMEAVGEGKDSPGSDLLIRGASTATTRARCGCRSGAGRTCSPRRCGRSAPRARRRNWPEFVAKLRVYAISDQDDSGPWLRKEFPGLFYITSPGFNAGGAYHHATWSGISGDNSTPGSSARTSPS